MWKINQAFSQTHKYQIKTKYIYIKEVADNEEKRAVKIIDTILIFVLVIWATVGVVDYIRVCNLKKPAFAVAEGIADDGGSGTYEGLGYSFNIEGNFMPDDDLPGVTHYKFYLFGKLMKESTRN